MKKKYSKQGFIEFGKIIYVLVLMLLPMYSIGQITFERIFGGISSESSYKVEICPDGGYITAGYTRSSGLGDASMHLIKTDKYGFQQWESVFGGNGVDYAYSLAVTDDGGCVAVGSTTSFGGMQANIYVVKVDEKGNKIWEKYFDGAGKDEGWDIRLTNDKGFIITGVTNSWGAKFNDVFLLKIDSDGNELWKKLYGGSSVDGGFCVRQTPDGGYAVLGQTHSMGEGLGDFYFFKTDADGNQQWEKTYGGEMPEEGRYFSLTNDGGFVLVGKTESFGAGDEDIYVVKTNSSGELEWSKTYGGELKDTGKSVEQTSDGGYIIASSSRSFGWINPSAWFIKVDNQGQEMWTKKYGGWGHDHGHHILPTDDGGYIATGHCNREESQMEDTYLLKLDSEGDWKIDTKVNESTLVYSLKIHPNPSTGTIELFLELNSSNYIEINIVNYSGSVVYQSSNDELHSTFSKKIDLQGFSKGIYLLTVSDGITLRTTKVILQ